jgi:hypothetical protein
MMYLDASQHLDELATLNAQHADRQIQPVAGTGGKMIVGADLLTDCGEGCYWHDYCEWLAKLAPTDAVPLPPDEPIA